MSENRSTDANAMYMRLPQLAGRVTEEEEPHAQALILDQFENLTGHREVPQMCGWFICVKLWIAPEEVSEVTDVLTGEKKTLYRPQMSQVEDKYRSATGLVVARGIDSYRDPVRFPFGPWCRIGDWVMVPRYEGFFFHFREVAMLALPDDKIIGLVSDPASVSAMASNIVRH